MERIRKAYEAIDMLESIGVPISREQLNSIKNLEREYLNEEVLPLLEDEVYSLAEKLKSGFEIDVYYDKENGLNILLGKDNSHVEDDSSAKEHKKRQRKYYIRVLFPDNHVSCSKVVWETLVDVVKYAGAENVKKLGLIVVGSNLVSQHLNSNEKYRVSQKEVEPGYYVCTYSSTDTKYDQIKQINNRLNLGLKLEKVLL